MEMKDFGCILNLTEALDVFHFSYTHIFVIWLYFDWVLNIVQTTMLVA